MRARPVVILFALVGVPAVAAARLVADPVDRAPDDARARAAAGTFQMVTPLAGR